MTSPANYMAQSYGTQNACLTSAKPYSLLWTSGFEGAAVDHMITTGFSASITTCPDYAADEMSISGTHTVTMWDNSYLRAAAPTPFGSVKGKSDNSDDKIWAI
jgi:hypothetical protein